MLWLICIAAGMLAFVGESSLTARDDAAVTAANIMANESLFRMTFVGDLFSGASYLGLTAILYHLLKPVGRSVSFVAAVFGLCGVAIGGVAFLAHIAPVVLLGGGRSLSAFTVGQLQAMALLAYRLRMQVFSIGMVFFGVQCILVGFLIARSTFLPRALGVLLALGGSSYVMVSLANFLLPVASPRFTPLFMPIALLGEGSLTVWLLAKGVNVEKWIDESHRLSPVRTA